MNLYGLDYSLFDLGYIDPTLIESISIAHSPIGDGENRRRGEENLNESSNITANSRESSSSKSDDLPPRRHDGTSPLPLGMDWSPSPLFWNGPNTIWPHDFRTGWSYCVTIPSWTVSSEPSSEPAVFYRVQVGLQSPEGVTTTQEVLRRFRDFLKLASALKRSFHYKKLPATPSKVFLRIKSREILEERRRSLENWMANVLSDIEFSRSAPLACFLELEAVARSSFAESSHQVVDINLSCNTGMVPDPFLSLSDAAIVAGTLSLASNFCDDSTYGTPEMLSPSLTETTLNEPSWDNSDGKLVEFDEGNQGYSNDVDTTNIYMISSPSDISDLREVPQQSTSASVEPTKNSEILCNLDSQFSHEKLVALPSDEQQKLNRILSTTQQRLVTSKADMEGLIARLNQEFAIRHYLTTKVKDLEIEIETTKKNGKENMEQAILIERERYTQMQWDMEETRRKCMEMELRLNAEQDNRVSAEATKPSIIQENGELRKKLDSAREQLKNLKKCQEDSDLRSKSDVKLLVKEIKSLRISQLELRQEVDRLTKERAESERELLKEKQKWEQTNSSNANLLHECEILRSRLEECSVNFLIEEENKLKMPTSSPSDAADILATSDNRVALLLAEAQLLAQEVESSVTITSPERHDVSSMNYELRKMLTSVFIDNAMLRKQVNSILRCTLWTSNESPDKSETVKEDSASRETVLGKFLES